MRTPCVQIGSSLGRSFGVWLCGFLLSEFEPGIFQALVFPNFCVGRVQVAFRWPRFFMCVFFHGWLILFGIVGVYPRTTDLLIYAYHLFERGAPVRRSASGRWTSHCLGSSLPVVWRFLSFNFIEFHCEKGVDSLLMTGDSSCAFPSPTFTRQQGLNSRNFALEVHKTKKLLIIEPLKFHYVLQLPSL